MSHVVSSLCNCIVVLSWLALVIMACTIYDKIIMIPMHGEVNQLFKPTQSRGVMEHPYKHPSKVLIVMVSRTPLKE